MKRYQSRKRLTVAPLGGFNQIFRSKQFWTMFLLAATVFVSAVSVVYVSAMDRILFSELQSLQKQNDALRVEWGQLLLEQSTWATQARIQRIAEHKLDMVVPKQKNIIMVTQ